MKNNKAKYEVVELLGKTALFTEERIKDDDVPEGMYKYDLREGDDSEFYFATVEKTRFRQPRRHNPCIGAD